MIYRLKKSIILKTTLSEAWEFFSNPRNLELITPPDLQLRITTDLTEAIYPGMIITYKVSPFLGISMNWVTEITQVNAPYFFVDEQRYGPYRMWHHQHRFKEVPDGVLVEDIVDYIMPFGPIGCIAHRVLVAKQLEGIFSFRSLVLAKQFGIIHAEKNSP